MMGVVSMIRQSEKQGTFSDMRIVLGFDGVAVWIILHSYNNSPIHNLILRNGYVSPFSCIPGCVRKEMPKILKWSHKSTCLAYLRSNSYLVHTGLCYFIGLGKITYPCYLS